MPSASIIRSSRPRWSSASIPLSASRELVADVADRIAHALAEPGLAPVAQLDRLELAGGCARRDRRPPERSVLEGDIHFHRRVPRESRIWRAVTSEMRIRSFALLCEIEVPVLFVQLELGERLPFGSCDPLRVLDP